MDITAKIQNRLDGVNSEHGILLLFIGTSAYMFIRAESWQFNTKVFPQVMAGAVIVGSLLLLVREYLPTSLQQVVTGRVGAFQTTEDLEEEIEEDEKAGSADVEEDGSIQYDRPLNPVLATGLLIVAYVLGGYLFSLFLMSPVFVAAYLLWFRQPWATVVFLSLLSLLIAYAFASMIIVPVDRGIIVGDLLMIRGVV